jgi:hypothetical protein
MEFSMKHLLACVTLGLRLPLSAHPAVDIGERAPAFTKGRGPRRCSFSLFAGRLAAQGSYVRLSTDKQDRQKHLVTKT